MVVSISYDRRFEMRRRLLVLSGGSGWQGVNLEDVPTTRQRRRTSLMMRFATASYVPMMFALLAPKDFPPNKNVFSFREMLFECGNM